MLAAMSGNEELVGLLLKAGALLDKKCDVSNCYNNIVAFTFEHHQAYRFHDDED